MPKAMPTLTPLLVAFFLVGGLPGSKVAFVD